MASTVPSDTPECDDLILILQTSDSPRQFNSVPVSTETEKQQLVLLSRCKDNELGPGIPGPSLQNRYTKTDREVMDPEDLGNRVLEKNSQSNVVNRRLTSGTHFTDPDQLTGKPHDCRKRHNVNDSSVPFIKQDAPLRSMRKNLTCSFEDVCKPSEKSHADNGSDNLCSLAEDMDVGDDVLAARPTERHVEVCSCYSPMASVSELENCWSVRREIRTPTGNHNIRKDKARVDRVQAHEVLYNGCIANYRNHTSDLPAHREEQRAVAEYLSRRKEHKSNDILRRVSTSGKRTLSFTMLHTIVLLLLAILSSYPTEAAKGGLYDLRCPPCQQIHCDVTDPTTLNCPGGVSTGVCGCCPVCARLAGQSCGGDWSYLGKCDKGLVCRTAPGQAAYAFPMQREPAGVCVKDTGRTHDQADAAPTEKCRPRCTPEFCSRRPRAVCSARDVAETARTCQGNCQHTSCRACFMEEEVECVKCSGKDFRCLKQFGRCIAKKRCRGKKGRKACKKKFRYKEGPGRRFVCEVPDCPG